MSNTLLDDLLTHAKLDESAGSARLDSHGAFDWADVNTVNTATGKVYTILAMVDRTVVPS